MNETWEIISPCLKGPKKESRICSFIRIEKEDLELTLLISFCGCRVYATLSFETLSHIQLSFQGET